jgi:hypothetical protein
VGSDESLSSHASKRPLIAADKAKAPEDHAWQWKYDWVDASHHAWEKDHCRAPIKLEGVRVKVPRPTRMSNWVDNLEEIKQGMGLIRSDTNHLNT